MIAWLIEYVGATPCPVYAPEDGGWLTCDPLQAKRFETKEDAQAFMRNPLDQPYNGVPFHEPWTAIEHSFDMKCEYCGGDPGFVRYGSNGWCDSCIPF